MHRTSLALSLLTSVFLASTATAQAVAPLPGELVISEIMFTPICAGTQNNGEWFEVTNVSSKVLDVNGVYFQDGAVFGASSSYFQVLPSVATLPPLYPGQRFVFARSDDPMLNGGLPQVDYAYSSQDPNNAVNGSYVGNAKMNFSSQSIDGMHISTGAPPSLGGTAIDSATYNPMVFPFQAPYAGGGSAERINLFGTFNATATTNDVNVAQALGTSFFGSCVIGRDWGTPGGANSTDGTGLWPSNTLFDSATDPNSGTLVPVGPISVGNPNFTFHLTGTASTFWGLVAFDDVATELPFALFIPGNSGSALMDFVSASDVAIGVFDGVGAATLPVAVPNNPVLVNLTIRFQWIGADFVNNVLQGSNGVRSRICP